MRARFLPGGIRASVMTTFAVGSLLISVVLAAATYSLARHYLVQQRERTALRQAYSDASLVRDGLSTSGATVADVLGNIAQPASTTIFVRRGGQWYSTALTTDGHHVTDPVARVVSDGSVGLSWTSDQAVPAVVVGVPLPAVGADYFEVTSVHELHDTLQTLLIILVASALVTTLAGAGIGLIVARRVLRPVHEVAEAAARISSGDFGARLGDTHDPDLATLVGSFNNMVDVVEERIEHDARFAADVSHELRTPLATLTTSLSVLQRAPDLSERSGRAVELMAGELERFRNALEDLIALGRLDAGLNETTAVPIRLDELVVQSLLDARGSADLLDAAGVRPGTTVVVDRLQVLRALLNLYRNADTHGRGLVGVRLTEQGRTVQIHVEDAGPGVEPEDRDRIFERFARSGARGSQGGTGLGLSIVQQTAVLHGGSVWCKARAGGGAEFVLSLPKEGKS